MHSARFFISVRSDGMRSDLASTGREPRLTPAPPALLQICHLRIHDDLFNHISELIGWTEMW